METSVRFNIFVQHPEKGLIPSVYTRKHFLTVEEANAYIPNLEKTIQKYHPTHEILPMVVVKSTLSFEIA